MTLAGKVLWVQILELDFPVYSNGCFSILNSDFDLRFEIILSFQRCSLWSLATKKSEPGLQRRTSFICPGWTEISVRLLRGRNNWRPSSYLEAWSKFDFTKLCKKLNQNTFANFSHFLTISFKLWLRNYFLWNPMICGLQFL